MRVPMAGFGDTAVDLRETEKRGLKRSMKVLGTLMITLSLCSPTAGVFVIMPGILVACGTGAFLTMSLGAVIGVFMAFIYAELSSAYPVAGGEYAMVGRAIGPAAGFLVLGVSLVSNILIPAVVALGISSYLGALYPNLPVVPTAMATIALTTLMCVLNIRTNAAITGAFLVLEMIVLGVLMVLSFAHVSRPLGDLMLHPVMLAGGSLIRVPAAAMGMAT